MNETKCIKNCEKARMIRKAEERTKAMIEWLDTNCPKMTKEEIINGLKLTIGKCLFDPYTVELSTEQISFTEKLTIDACKGAIDLLEQEPFINKDCVSKGVCHEDKIKVLDKISAEIEKQEKWLDCAGYNAYNVDIAFNSIKLLLKESRDME